MTEMFDSVTEVFSDPVMTEADMYVYIPIVITLYTPPVPNCFFIMPYTGVVYI